MPRHRSLDEILRSDPVRDHQRIVFLSAAFEFPFDLTRSLEFALFRTFAVPSIGRLLDQTGEFGGRAQKRYDDTDLILSQIYEYGYDSERGRRALRRMNHLHGRFEISNEDFLYVLTTFVFEPVRWIRRFGWRDTVENERLAFFHFWSEVGRRMNIRDIPADYEAMERYNLEYERSRFRFSPESSRVAEATRAMFLDWFVPRPLHRFGRPVVHALLDEPLLAAFGFPEPGRFLRSVVTGALRARSRFVRMLPERRHPRVRSEMRHRTYPDGYRTESLGPPPAD
ncbi:MAG: oxygenase MpaB family protein [Gemmatimonadetes bacterium]|nr:oxygenase MpaB family protein [Gemmatimonadota bacterium]